LSRVYKAKDLVAASVGLARPLVALKLIVADDKADPDVIALMHREARRLRELVHPNIVRVYDMNIEDDIHFMVMECLEGQTLARALRTAPDHKLVPAQVDRIVADIAASLHHAHLNNIIHADLKPANIFITTSGQLKLIDFNIAYPAARASKEDEEDTVEILGRLGGVTPAYASPERLAGDEPSEGDDIFSLAVVIHLALTGVRPFGELNALEAKEKGLAAKISRSLPLARRMALTQALSLDDKDRMHSVAAFASAYLGSPVSAFLTRLGL
jgi:serine/threonine protein kinase